MISNEDVSRSKLREKHRNPSMPYYAHRFHPDFLQIFVRPKHHGKIRSEIVVHFSFAVAGLQACSVP